MLIGGGDSHLEVLRRFGLDPLPDTELTLVSPHPRALYSGMRVLARYRALGA